MGFAHPNSDWLTPIWSPRSLRFIGLRGDLSALCEVYCKAMYRTLLACGSEVFGTWKCSKSKHLKFSKPHVASNVRYIAFAMRTNSILIPTKAQYAFSSWSPRFPFQPNFQGRSRIFKGISQIFKGRSSFAAGCFRFFSAHSQRPAGAGRVTRGRRSRDPRARVAGNLLGKIGFRASAVHCNCNGYT